MINKKIVRLTESQLHDIINKTVSHILCETDFKQVNDIQDYIKQNNLTSRRAYKNAPVNMQLGSDYVRQYIKNHPELSREEIRAIIKNGAPLETIASDGTKETGNMVTRNHRVVNNVGTPDNRWAVTDDFFDKTYSQGNDGEYNPTGAYRDAYQVNEPINIPTPWGDTMNVDKGGYIFRNPDNGKGQEEWYGISGKDFDNSYKFQENKKHKNKLIEKNMAKKVVRLSESQLQNIITESVKRILRESDDWEDQYEDSKGYSIQSKGKNPNKEWRWVKKDDDGWEEEYYHPKSGHSFQSKGSGPNKQTRLVKKSQQK